MAFDVFHFGLEFWKLVLNHHWLRLFHLLLLLIFNVDRSVPLIEGILAFGVGPFFIFLLFINVLRRPFRGPLGVLSEIQTIIVP